MKIDLFLNFIFYYRNNNKMMEVVFSSQIFIYFSKFKHFFQLTIFIQTKKNEMYGDND